ncbi:LapA family protein [Sphingomonas sp. Y38-1Y]|uniref:LapA family protein n=1 Tax=Sphingomonas sp. Y38-1Y TaxID=3078265 RepID=UPI0028E8C3D8|nr:LapA family protein [Sphingomonas sp. Y38-1Y]
MQFLRTLIWVLVAGIVVAFSFNNWAPVPVRLWGGLVADINLPLLMGVMFLLGFVPAWLVHVGTRWRLKSRLASSERTLADLRAAQPAAPAGGVTLAQAPADPVIEPAAAPPLIPGDSPVETRA